MDRKTLSTLVGIAFVTFVLSGPASAGSLLSLGEGSAGDDSVINVGIGGGDGNVLDVNVGGSSNDLASANINTGNGINANANLLGSGGVNADLNLLGNGNIVSANVGVGGLGVDIGIGTPGGPGNPGGPGGPGGVVALAGLTQADLACVGPDGSRILQLAGSSSNPRSWQRASNVQIVPVRLCPDVRRKIAAALRKSGVGGVIWGAVSQDALILASLSRTSYGVDDVFAVQQSGRQLTVFVF